MLIVLHDGPDARFRPTFDPWIQYVVNELGFAVLAPNVRGSSRLRQRASARSRAASQREDAIKDVGALLVWLALDSRFDKTHVIVSGTGYGGYLALAAAGELRRAAARRRGHGAHHGLHRVRGRHGARVARRGARGVRR